MTDAVRSYLSDRLDIEHQVAAKALEDPSFVAELRQDPRAAVEALLGCELPDALTVRIVEQGSTEIVATVPAPEEEALSEEALTSVAGGGVMLPDMTSRRMQFLMLQQSIQQQSRQFQTISNALTASHEAASSSIRNMK